MENKRKIALLRSVYLVAIDRAIALDHQADSVYDTGGEVYWRAREASKEAYTKAADLYKKWQCAEDDGCEVNYIHP